MPKLATCGFATLVALGCLLLPQRAEAQRPQYKIQPDGVVLKLQRLNITTFQYVRFAQAEQRRDGEGNAIWYFKAETGKEYTAPAPNQPAAPVKYTRAQLEAALARANTNGHIPTAAVVENVRGVPHFTVRFEKNTLGLRWHAQIALSAQEYEIVNRTLVQQGYQPLFAEPYTAADRSARFFAAWRR